MIKKYLIVLGVAATMFGFNFSTAFDVFAAQVATYNDITGSDAARVMLSEKDILVLDVRTQQEYTGDLGHLKGAKLIPVDELSSRLGEIAAYKKKKVLVVCRSGVRSKKAAAILVGAGFENVNNIIPGMSGMAQVPGAPIEK